MVYELSDEMIHIVVTSVTSDLDVVEVFEVCQVVHIGCEAVFADV